MEKKYTIGDYVMVNYLDEWLTAKVTGVLPNDNYEVEVCLLFTRRKPGILTKTVVFPVENMRDILIY